MALGTQNMPYLQHHQMMMPQVTNKSSVSYMRHIPIAPVPVGHKQYSPYEKAYGAGGCSLPDSSPSVVRRNARERNRVKQVNNGFVSLRQHIPQAIIADLSNGKRGGCGPGASKKLSKVDTLRMALEYIRRLKNVIDEVDSSSDTSSMSSYNSGGSSIGGSPPPPPPSSMAAENVTTTSYHVKGSYEQPYYMTETSANYQQNHHQSAMVSPSASSTSSYYSAASSDAAVESEYLTSLAHVKFENSFEDYNNTSTEDEELLDYISLWQDDM